MFLWFSEARWILGNVRTVVLFEFSDHCIFIHIKLNVKQIMFFHWNKATTAYSPKMNNCLRQTMKEYYIYVQRICTQMRTRTHKDLITTNMKILRQLCFLSSLLISELRFRTIFKTKTNTRNVCIQTQNDKFYGVQKSTFTYRDLW